MNIFFPFESKQKTTDCFYFFILSTFKYAQNYRDFKNISFSNFCERDRVKYGHGDYFVVGMCVRCTNLICYKPFAVNVWHSTLLVFIHG